MLQINKKKLAQLSTATMLSINVYKIPAKRNMDFEYR